MSLKKALYFGFVVRIQIVLMNQVNQFCTKSNGASSFPFFSWVMHRLTPSLHYDFTIHIDGNRMKAVNAKAV